MNIIQVNGDVMYPYKQIHPVPKGQVRFSKIKFNFSDDWENREVIVQFVQDDKTPINKPIESDGTCFVPDSIDLGMLFVYLRGYSSDGTSIATSNGVKIPIVQGPFDGGEPEVPPSPDLYSQLVNQVSQYAEEAKSSADRAEEASVNSPKIGNNGNWFVWDFEANQYVDTGVPASGGGAVSSVNGKTGAVKLTAVDVGAAPAERVERLAEEVGGKITAPATAQVGQTIRIKAVDETGRPTEWEAADMAAGGEWELINEVTVTEEVGPIIFTKDSNGNDFSLKRAYINAKCYGLADATSNALIIINLSDIPKDDGYKIAAIRSGIPAASSIRPARSACYIEKVGETFFSNCSGTASTGYETTPINDACFNCILPDKENSEYRDLESISKVCIWSNTYYSKNTFGVGTVIKLWGVRE